MNVYERVDPCDLEQSDDPGIGGDDAKPACSRAVPRRSDERPDAGRVEERAAREVDHEYLARDLRKRFLEQRRGCQVELTRHPYDVRTPGRDLAANVKIAWRGHGDRV